MISLTFIGLPRATLASGAADGRAQSGARRLLAAADDLWSIGVIQPTGGPAEGIRRGLAIFRDGLGAAIMGGMDLNADLGESFGAYTIGDDAALLDVVTSASVACGFHAGDPVVMTRTVAAAAKRGVVVGAHVGYRDLQGFGRRPMAVAPAELRADVLYQLGALDGITRSLDARVRYVKAHGALYNTAAADASVAAALVDGVRAYDETLAVVCLPGSAVAARCAEARIPFVAECFADRAYTSAGTLVPRSTPGAVIHDPDAVAARAVAMATTGRVRAVDGSEVEVAAGTMCVHGDTPDAAALARSIRSALESAGVSLAPFA